MGKVKHPLPYCCNCHPDQWRTMRRLIQKPEICPKYSIYPMNDKKTRQTKYHRHPEIPPAWYHPACCDQPDSKSNDESMGKESVNMHIIKKRICIPVRKKKCPCCSGNTQQNIDDPPKTVLCPDINSCNPKSHTAQMKW